jgi:hypothetical protein
MSVRTSYIYVPIWAKFGIRGLHTVLVDMCQDRERRRREGRTFLTGVNKVTFACVRAVQSCDVLRVKNVLVQRAYRVTQCVRTQRGMIRRYSTEHICRLAVYTLHLWTPCLKSYM